MPNFHDCALGLCSNAISSRIGRTAAIRSSDYRAASTKMIQPVTVRPESSVLGSAITHFSICFAWGRVILGIRPENARTNAVGYSKVKGRGKTISRARKIMSSAQKIIRSAPRRRQKRMARATFWGATVFRNAANGSEKFHISNRDLGAGLSWAYAWNLCGVARRQQVASLEPKKHPRRGPCWRL